MSKWLLLNVNLVNLFFLWLIKRELTIYPLMKRHTTLPGSTSIHLEAGLVSPTEPILLFFLKYILANIYLPRGHGYLRKSLPSKSFQSAVGTEWDADGYDTMYMGPIPQKC